jgi:hypothetical protein
MSSALAAAAFLSALRPDRAVAGCGGVKYAAPRHIDPGHRPPLAVGDSTMLLAVEALARIGFEANARGCRPSTSGSTCWPAHGAKIACPRSS